MRQTLHIFRKDVRHCWPYIAGVLAVMVANAWLLAGWFPLRAPHGETVTPLAIMIGLSCWLATAAAVHGESLAGDRQFWITRPYSWKSLLAAKLLFLAAFIGLPVFASDCVVLFASGFNPLPLIPGLLLRQCWLAAFLVLPFLIAVLTRSVRNFALAGMLFYVGLTLATAYYSSPAFQGLSRAEPSCIWIIAQWLLPVAGLALAAWHYSRRRTVLARGLAIGLAVLTPFWVLPALDPRAQVAGPEDPRSRNVTVQIDLDPAGKHSDSSGRLIWVRISASGWPRDMLTCDWLDEGSGNYRVSTTPDDLGWRGVVSADGWVRTPSPDRLLSADVQVYEPKATVELRSNGGWTGVPGFGSVRWLEKKDSARLIARTALIPIQPDWAYRIGGPRPDGEWQYSGPLRASPLTFGFSPVYSTESATEYSSPPPRSTVFTARRRIATLHRELKIPQSRPAGYEAGNP